MGLNKLHESDSDSDLNLKNCHTAGPFSKPHAGARIGASPAFRFHSGLRALGPYLVPRHKKIVIVVIDGVYAEYQET